MPDYDKTWVNCILNIPLHGSDFGGLEVTHSAFLKVRKSKQGIIESLKAPYLYWKLFQNKNTEIVNGYILNIIC